MGVRCAPPRGPASLALAAAVALSALAAGAAGQEAAMSPAARALAARVAAAGDGPVRFTFPVRPGACGVGDAIVIREDDGSTSVLGGRWTSAEYDRWRDGETPCVADAVVVRLEQRAGVVTAADVRVTLDDIRPATDLGAVGAQAAADYLFGAATRAPGRVGRTMLLAATLADGAVTWPGLLGIGRDGSIERATRRAAIHWLGRQASAEAVRGLGGIVRDGTEEDRIREAAVFALSRLPDGRGVTLLIEVVRTIEDPRVRGRAIFWLAQSEDPRALALFEEILARR